MSYYEVLIGDASYHSSEPLTYSSAEPLTMGKVVRVHLRNKLVLAIVIREVSKPNFTAKEIFDYSPTPPLSSNTIELIHWLHGYYPAPFGTIVKLFLPGATSYPKSLDSSTEHVRPLISLPPLTEAQSRAISAVKPRGYHLLHGVTGSGKTRVYLELAKQTLKNNKSVLVITPEIGLTAQTARSFAEAFPETVTILHSRLTVAARRNEWYRLASATSPQIVIGARSALFSPLNDIGLILIDEAHDQSLKSDALPKYRTDRVAAKLASLYNCPLVCGSATPNIEDYYVALQKKVPVITLAERAIKHSHSLSTHIVDLKDRSAFSKSFVVSDTLQKTIADALQRNEQILLFLNRRGTANAILCNVCGWQAICPHCDLPLSYHKDSHEVRCHVCGRKYPLPTQCPDCANADIVLKNIGTKAIVDEIARLFPSARTARFDTDTSKKDQLETQLDELKSGAIDILVGTQMIAKGLDLPKLSVVGVLNADSSLHIPDYSAHERTYQLLTQVIGRVGRGHTSGHIVVQSYEPKSIAIRAALSDSYMMFYDHEIHERQQFSYPPFTYILKLSCLRATAKGAEKAATGLATKLHERFPDISIDGPAPTFHPKEQGKYKWQLIVKSPHRSLLLKVIDELPANWTHDIDPINLL